MDGPIIATVFFDEPLVLSLFLSGMAVFVVTYIAMLWSSKREQANKDQSLRNSRAAFRNPHHGGDDEYLGDIAVNDPLNDKIYVAVGVASVVFVVSAAYVVVHFIVKFW